MGSENQFWLKMWTMVGVCLTTVILGGLLYFGIIAYKCIDKGYTQASIPGHTGVEWVR